MHPNSIYGNPLAFILVAPGNDAWTADKKLFFILFYFDILLYDFGTLLDFTDGHNDLSDVDVTTRIDRYSMRCN